MEVKKVKAGQRAESSHYLGINIGGTTCSVAVGDRRGNLKEEVSWKTAEAPTPGAAVAAIVERVQAFTEACSLEAAGVAIGGPLDTRAGVVLGPPNLPGWERVPLKADLEKALKLPVRVAHDAAACALAEARFGEFRGMGSLVYLTCGTGFGAGVVVNGKMLEGTGGVHPEIGHWRLREDGPVAFGRPGSAEALCSGPALSRIAAWRHPVRWADRSPEPGSVSQLARQGDAMALDVVEFHARMTGRVCAMIAELLCPETILLGSLARHMGVLWVEPVIRHYREEVLDRVGETVTVTPATLGERLQNLSALVVAMEGVRG